MDGKKVVTNVLLFAAGAGLGFATGYFLQKRKYEALLISEIEQVKEAYSGSYSPYKPYKSPEEAVEALIPEDERSEFTNILEGNGYVQVTDGDTVVVKDFEGETIATGVAIANEHGELEIHKDEPEEKPAGPVKYNNVFNEKGPARAEDDLSNPEPLAKNLPARMGPPVSVVEEELPVEQERMLRNPDKPYIITLEQYMGEGDDMHEDDKITLTYFEEDDTLVDEKETIVPNLEELVGEINLHHFGLGSKDVNAVYIRNERIQADFEVIRDKRGYQEIVLGIKPERQKNGPLRMRDDDQ